MSLPVMFGQYKMVGKLGEGGMGTVYLVEAPDGVRFALKTLREEAAANVGYVERFLRETRIAMRLKHRHIVETYDAGQAPDGTLYMLCEFCPGGSLRDRMEERRQIAPAEAVRWMAGAAEALDYASIEHDVIHRDIKPENLLLDSAHRLKLADLGLARRTSGDATRLTVEGSVLGSAYYISPEQARAEDDLDTRTDLYGLGATFYDLLAGTPPFTGSTAAILLTKHVHETPAPLSSHRPDLPRPLVELIHSLLEKDRSNRPAGPRALLDELRRVAERSEIDLGTPAVSPSPERTIPAETAELAPARRVVFQLSGEFSTEVTEVSERPAAPALDDVTDPHARTLTCPREAPESESATLALRCLSTDAPPWPEACAWLKVSEPAGGRSWDVAVYAAFPVRFGRKRGKGVELPLRVYPVEENRELCMKVSSLHGQFDATDAGWTVTDLDSHNGVKVNGKRILESAPYALPGRAKVEVSSAVCLQCFTLPRSLPDRVTIDGDAFKPAATPAMTLYREGNRPELAYALIRDRLPVGGADPSRGLVLPGMSSPECGALWWLKRSFWWQANRKTTVLGQTALLDHLMPLPAGAQWSAATLQLSIRAFSYDLFK